MKTESKAVPPGPSILERLWEELDAIVDRLESEGEPDEEPYEHDGYDIHGLQHVRDVWMAYGEERGKAQGTAYAIAMMTNPYEPNIEAVRAEAVERWEARLTETAGIEQEGSE